MVTNLSENLCYACAWMAVSAFKRYKRTNSTRILFLHPFNQIYCLAVTVTYLHIELKSESSIEVVHSSTPGSSELRRKGGGSGFRDAFINNL